MRIKLLFILLCGLIIVLSCEKEDVLPQLQIMVNNLDSVPLQDVKVSLFETQNDYTEDTNVVETLYTDNKGITKFIDLKEIVYYFRAEKDTLDNYYTDCYLKDPLQKNHLVKISITIK